MNDALIVNGKELEVWTGYGPGDLGWGTRVWFQLEKVLHVDWPDSAEVARTGHQLVVTLLKALDTLGPDLVNEAVTAAAEAVTKV